MAQMDLAAGIRAGERARCRVVTAAVKEMAFQRPVKIGDTLSIYTDITRIGRTSITLQVEAWVNRSRIGRKEKVTEGTFIMVALDDHGAATPVPQE
jgi:acyl-CoA thioesterase YciA